MHEAPPPQPTPEWVNAIADRVAALLIERHLCPAGEVWGLARRFLGQPLPYDEVGSGEFLHIVREYDLWDRMPPLDEQERRRVVEFWQRWQDPKTGRFVDPRDPGREVNEKYIVGLLNQLGAGPLYPWTTTSETGEIDPAPFLARAREAPDWERGGWGVASHTGLMALQILRAVEEEGRLELIPALEDGIGLMLSHQGPDGLWGPGTAPLWGRIGGTLKVLSRLYFQLGMPVPRTRELADTLIRQEEDGEFFRCSTDVCIPRNVAEVIAYCLEASDYRRGDLLGTLPRVVEDLRAHVNPDGSMSANRGGPGGIAYGVMYGLGVCGGCLNWIGCRLPDPLLEKRRGAGMRFRPVLRPDGSVRIVARGAEA